MKTDSFTFFNKYKADIYIIRLYRKVVDFCQTQCFNDVVSTKGYLIMKKLEIIIRPERLDDLKTILNSNGAHGLMISNIMGYGSQRGHKQVYNGVDFGGNLLPKVKVEAIVSDETYETIIDQIIEQINTGEYGDGKIFVYDVYDAIRIRTGERGTDAL